MAIEALTQAKLRGIRTHVTNQAAALAATPSVTALADEVSTVDFARPEETVDWVRRRISAGERIDVVLALQEMAQIAGAEAAKVLRVPGNPPDVVRCARTKDACRAALAAGGFVQPIVRLCTNADEARECLQESVGPWIVKPRDAMGSVGVSQVSEVAELPSALALLPDSNPFLVEEFVDGPEFSVEGLFLDGTPQILGITAKEKTSPPFFVEIGHVLPADLSEVRRHEVERQVTSALSTLGLRSGAFHVELWFNSSGIVLGEIHARLGGDWIHRMLAHAIPGVELYGLIYDDMLSRSNSRRSLQAVRGAAVRYLTPPPGRVISVRGWKEILAHPAVLYAELTVAAGDLIRPIQRSSDRIGLIVVGTDTSAQARKLALELSLSVEFRVDRSAVDFALSTQ